ncbi:AAA family ATPase [Thermoflexus sp.]|uniref:ATP-binding protein n=1 Tax=Thermoflexus sp. TaxID=1969742 RepID=UPI002ADD539D|nr:AAA family ATPase [Thermoflexus sp.]
MSDSAQHPRADHRLNVLRPPAEQRFAEELTRLAAEDRWARPAGWRLSPRMVEAFIMGDPRLGIRPKYVGDRALIQVAIATLASDRALMLIGEPGTGKSYLSEHLAAAICGTSQLTIQGTAGVTEDQIKYSWNYALLLAEGPSDRALVPSPLLIAMRTGRIARFEELTRCPSEVQDALISVLSEKAMAIPELERIELAQRGFNLIATANTRDRGVHEMSAALRRRFNFVELPVISDLQQEIEIVERRTRELMSDFDIQVDIPRETVEALVTIFQELRQGQTIDGSQKVKRPSTVMSTAEAISTLFTGCLLASYFGSGRVGGQELLRTLIGAVSQEDPSDLEALMDYIETVIKRRKGKVWNDLYRLKSQLKR